MRQHAAESLCMMGMSCRYIADYTAHDQAKKVFRWAVAQRAQPLS